MPFLSSLLERIQPADHRAGERAHKRQQNLTMPTGALGELEEVAVRLAAVFGTEKPHPRGVAVVVAAASHGVATEGVSCFDPEVTAHVRDNIASGGAAVNALAGSLNARVWLLDAGVEKQSGNIRIEQALSPHAVLTAIEQGAALAAEALGEADLLIPAEVGIGNTTAAAALTARLLSVPAEAVTGRGSGVNDEVLEHKRRVVTEAVQRSKEAGAVDPLDLLAHLGGADIAAMLGMMLETAAQKKVIILDGFVEGAAALLGVRLVPAMRDYLFAAGECSEAGHALQLQALGLRPLFALGLRLGEGTGGVLAAPLLLGAAAALREVKTFEEAGVARAAR